MSIARIVVVGSINMDVAVRVKALPRHGETVPGDDAVLSLGGKGANQAVGARRLGADVALIGAIGMDAFGDAALASLRGEGVNLDGVFREKSAATGVALITIGADGQNMITLSPGANATLSTSYVLNRVAQLKSSNILLLQNETPAAVAHASIQVMRQSGGLVIVDPAPASGFDPALIAIADYLTPNETEAAELTGIIVQSPDDGLAAARSLVERGARHALIKLGARGAIYAGAAGEGHVPAPVVNAIDTVAAGDCFNGALAVALGEGRPLPDALIFACKAASIAVTRSGASQSMPYRHELA